MTVSDTCIKVLFVCATIYILCALMYQAYEMLDFYAWWYALYVPNLFTFDSFKSCIISMLLNIPTWLVYTYVLCVLYKFPKIRTLCFGTLHILLKLLWSLVKPRTPNMTTIHTNNTKANNTKAGTKTEMVTDVIKNDTDENENTKAKSE